MKKKISFFSGMITEKTGYYFRRLCYGMSPPARIITVLTLFILFALFNLYVAFRGIYSIFGGDSKESPMDIKHIESLDIPRNDSINNQLNKKFYEYK